MQPAADHPLPGSLGQGQAWGNQYTKVDKCKSPTQSFQKPGISSSTTVVKRSHLTVSVSLPKGSKYRARLESVSVCLIYTVSFWHLSPL